jgi:hypothetical protein
MTLSRSLLAWFCLSATALAQPGFTSLFNGRDLTGWDGDPRLWKVEQGIVVGTSSGPGSPEKNTFLIWRGGVVKDFELRATLRLLGDNNSGIQYRSRPLPEAGPWGIMGYQCDVHPALEHTGMTYEERGRGIFGLNGNDVVLDPSGQRWLVATREPVRADLSQWNEFTIVARGNRLEHRLNGRITSVFIDHDEKGRALEGLLAIQLHAGNPYQVQIKDLQLRVIADATLTAFDPAALPPGAKKIDKPRTTRPMGVNPPHPAKKAK